MAMVRFRSFSGELHGNTGSSRIHMREMRVYQPMTGKGSRREQQAVSIYQSAGMGTYRPATVRFGENDMMGLFDFLAFSPSHTSIHAVQVKSNAATGLQAWVRHTQLFRRLGFRTFYLVPKDGEGWLLYEAGEEPEDGRRAAKLVVDERELENVGPNRDTEYNTGHGITQWLREETESDE